MFTCAIETSTRCGGLAILRDTTLLSEFSFDPQFPASQKLLPAIQNMLKQQNLQLNDIDYYAVAIGPGSFTGLRVGLTAAKTLAYLNQKAVIPVPTLDALAFPLYPCPDQVVALMDARKNEVYGAVYDFKNGFNQTMIPAVSPVETFISPSQKQLFIGDGAALYKERIIKFTEHAIFAPEQWSHPKSASVGHLSITGRYKSFSGEELFHLIPVYLRRSEAEVVWEKKYGSNSSGMN